MVSSEPCSKDRFWIQDRIWSPDRIWSQKSLFLRAPGYPSGSHNLLPYPQNEKLISYRLACLGLRMRHLRKPERT